LLRLAKISKYLPERCEGELTLAHLEIEEDTIRDKRFDVTVDFFGLLALSSPLTENHIRQPIALQVGRIFSLFVFLCVREMSNNK